MMDLQYNMMGNLTHVEICNAPTDPHQLNYDPNVQIKIN
jgi:hypothetical protein